MSNVFASQMEETRRGVFRGGRGVMPPNRRLSKFFTEKPALLGLFSLPENSVDLKYAKNALAAGDPTKGAHDASPDSIVGWPPAQSPPLSAPLAARFSRLQRSASVPPNVKSWLCPWRHRTVLRVIIR